MLWNKRKDTCKLKTHTNKLYKIKINKYKNYKLNCQTSLILNLITPNKCNLLTNLNPKFTKRKYKMQNSKTKPNCYKKRSASCRQKSISTELRTKLLRKRLKRNFKEYRNKIWTSSKNFINQEYKFCNKKKMI